MYEYRKIEHVEMMQFNEWKHAQAHWHVTFDEKEDNQKRPTWTGHLPGNKITNYVHDKFWLPI